jgi:hypothetical protein
MEIRRRRRGAGRRRVTIKTRRFGDEEATRKVISRLRAELCELFGLEESPFHRYRRGKGWRLRFQAQPDLPSDE